jgi:hypothetical protein
MRPKDFRTRNLPPKLALPGLGATKFLLYPVSRPADALQASRFFRSHGPSRRIAAQAKLVFGSGNDNLAEKLRVT